MVDNRYTGVGYDPPYETPVENLVIYVVVEEDCEGCVYINEAFKNEQEAENYARANSNEIVTMTVNQAILR